MKTKLKPFHSLNKIMIFSALLGISALSNAQENDSKISFGANVDGYYKLDPSQNHRVSKTRFTETHNSFEIGMASFDAKYTSKKLSSFIDLGAGKRVDQFSYTGQNSELFIKQFYVTYNLTDDFSITGGTWKKDLGYEHINAVDNGNYSMSYTFSNSPFFTTGLKANLKIEKFNFSIGATNPTDFRSAINAGNTLKSFSFQAGYNTEKTKIVYNAQKVGTKTTDTYVIQNDIVAEHKLNEKFTGALNLTFSYYNFNTVKSWGAIASYIKYSHSENIKLNYRVEYFNSSRRYPIGYYYTDYNGANIISNTLSLNYKIGNLTLIPELRVDYANKKIFMLDKTTSQVNPYFIIGTTYKF